MVVADTLNDFFSRFGLNKSSYEAFTQLDHGTQAAIMASFAPRDASRDNNSLFMSFLRSRTGTGDDAQEKLAQHERFLAKWGLDEISELAMLSLNPTAQADVMATFHPRDTSRDANAVFLSFVKSRGGILPPNAVTTDVSALPLVAPLTASQQEMVDVSDEVEAFFAMWKLSGEAQRTLLALTPTDQLEIMQSFRPRDVTRDANGIFLSFLRSRLGSKLKTRTVGRRAKIQPPEMSRDDFQNTWGLNHSSLQFLDSLPQQIQSRIITDFNPRDKSRDANSCFMSFAKSRACVLFAETWDLNEESIAMFNDLPLDKQQDILATFRPRDTARDVNPVFMSYVRSRMGEKKRPLDRVTRFAEEWRLNAESIGLLTQLPEEEQTRLMSQFHPRDRSRDCNAIFAKFIASRAV